MLCSGEPPVFHPTHVSHLALKDSNLNFITFLFVDQNKAVMFCKIRKCYRVTVGGKPVTTTLDSLREALVIDIKILRNILSKDESELYTPKDNGVKCAKVALTCFLEETKVIEKENAHNYSITATIHRIQRNADAGWRQLAEGDIAQPNECLQCESYEVQTTGVFLERMVEFVQFAFRDNVFGRH